eukprot:4447915-Pyramimonas_sp.AAC.1
MTGIGTFGELNLSCPLCQNPSGNVDYAAEVRTRLAWRGVSTVIKRALRQPLISSSWHFVMALLLLLLVFSGSDQPRHLRLEIPLLQQEGSRVGAVVPAYGKSASKEIDVRQ